MNIGIAAVSIRKIFKPKIIKVYTSLSEVTERNKSWYSFYYVLRALEYNDAFTSEIADIRKRLNIPPSGFHYTTFEKKQLNINGLDTEVQRLFKDYHVSWWLAVDYDNIARIIAYNCVFPIFLQKINHYGIFEESDDHENADLAGIYIKILQPVKKDTLQKYIDANWKYIKGDMERIPKYPSAPLGDLDLEILDLRDREHKKFQEIADYLLNNKKVKEGKGDKEDDRFRIRYNRIKKKTNNLFYKK